MKHRWRSPRATPIPIGLLKILVSNFAQQMTESKLNIHVRSGGAFTFWTFVADSRRIVRHKKEVAIKIIFASIVIGPLMLVGALPAAAASN
jgi:hypothetical protein